MVQKSLLVLAIRIAAIVLLVGVVQDIPDFVKMFENYHDLGSSPYFWFKIVAPELLLILLALFMWNRPESLLGKLTPAETPLSDTEDFSQLSVILFAAIGLYITASALEDFTFYFLLDEFVAEQFPDVPVEDKPENKAGLYTSMLKLAMGIFIMFGSNALSRMFNALRKLGIAK